MAEMLLDRSLYFPKNNGYIAGALRLQCPGIVRRDNYQPKI